MSLHPSAQQRAAVKGAQSTNSRHAIPHDFTKCRFCLGLFKRENLERVEGEGGRYKLICKTCKTKQMKKTAASLFGFDSIKELSSWAGTL